MSFSHDARNEIARIIPEKRCCQIAELSALVGMRADISPNRDGVLTLYTTMENAAQARKAYTLLKDTFGLSSTVHILQKKRFKKSRIYRVETPLDSAEGSVLLQELGQLGSEIKRQVHWKAIRKNCCKRAFLRGVFTSSGFVNRPEGNYHLEIVFNDSRMAADVLKVMNKLDLDARLTERKNNLLIYIKESERIVDFLRLVEASNALLDFENVRIIKSMRNQVNRQVNCETANLGKTIDASVRQVEMIKRIVARVGVKGISPHLRELAMLRLDHPDSSLKELGLMLDPPLTKSGVAYRMAKLEKVSDTIDQLE
ncbi:MAG: DNA-binding protein WhiA [Syntrophomonadaceae bacterium]|nr:DNA-binding protein WhiA [Syntrophomonadaceae bacterium]